MNEEREVRDDRIDKMLEARMNKIEKGELIQQKFDILKVMNAIISFSDDKFHSPAAVSKNLGVSATTTRRWILHLRSLLNQMKILEAFDVEFVEKKKRIRVKASKRY